jgi:lysophospholipase L1-like esterase
MMYRDILVLIILLVCFSLLLSLSLGAKSRVENDPILVEEEYPEEIDTLEEFIQSYYLLLDSTDYLSRFSIIKHEKNVVSNPNKNLDEFYHKLLELRNGVRDRVSIFQIGDSHIQSGYFSGTARTSLQKYYGNAGRGLVFPWRLAGTNQPDDIRISSTTSWNRTNSEKGICGYGLWTKTAGSLSIRTNNFFGLDNSYNKITLITKEKENTYDWRMNDFLEVPYIEIQGFADQAIYQLQWNTPVREVELQFRSEDPTDIANLYGIVLEQSVPGLLYHSMGVNGATLGKFSAIDDFFAQIKLLNPDLVVISLGTNDAQGRYNNSYFQKQLNLFMSQLRQHESTVPVIFTLPPDSNKGGKHNADLEKVERELMAYAEENNCAWWHLSDVMGGKNSIQTWRNHGLAAKDLLHFTPKGYMLQGHLFYQALIKGYKDYAESKR